MEATKVCSAQEPNVASGHVETFLKIKQFIVKTNFALHSGPKILYLYQTSGDDDNKRPFSYIDVFKPLFHPTWIN